MQTKIYKEISESESTNATLKIASRFKRALGLLSFGLLELVTNRPVISKPNDARNINFGNIARFVIVLCD